MPRYRKDQLCPAMVVLVRIDLTQRTAMVASLERGRLTVSGRDIRTGGLRDLL